MGVSIFDNLDFERGAEHAPAAESLRFMAAPLRIDQGYRIAPQSACDLLIRAEAFSACENPSQRKTPARELRVPLLSCHKRDLPGRHPTAPHKHADGIPEVRK
jgi:hypothetical protein